MRVLIKDRSRFPEQAFEVVRAVVVVVVQLQSGRDHLLALRDDLRPAMEAGDVVADVAVILLDGESKVFAGMELFFGYEPVEALPVVRDKDFTFHSDFVEELPAGLVVALAKDPAKSSFSNRIESSP